MTKDFTNPILYYLQKFIHLRFYPTCESPFDYKTATVIVKLGRE